MTYIVLKASLNSKQPSGSDLEEASSTQKSAKTRAGNVFVTRELLTIRYGRLTCAQKLTTPK